MKKLLLVFIFAFATSLAFAGERIDLATPDQAVAGTSTYYIWALLLDRDAKRVEIRLNSPTGVHRIFVFTGEDALTYIKVMNKRDASTISNEKWTLQQLISRGALGGTISGTPD